MCVWVYKRTNLWNGVATDVPRLSLFCGITQRLVVIPRRYFAITHRGLWAETSARNYHYTPRNIPEERISPLHRGGNLKSYNRRFSLQALLVQWTHSDDTFWIPHQHARTHTHTHMHTHARTHTHKQRLCFNPHLNSHKALFYETACPCVLVQAW
jgi:hypothetical protein